MPNFSMPNLRETFFAMNPTRYARASGLERYFLGNEISVDGFGLGTSFNFGATGMGLKGDIVSSQGGCCCAACMEGSARQSGTGPTFAPDLVPGSISSTATVNVGGSVDVSIDTLGDRDYYRVTLTAGVTYTIQTSSDGTGTDAFLNIRDASGTLLTSDDDTGDGVNSLVSFTPTTSGVFYIDAGTYNNQTTGTYHLFVAAAVPAGDFVAGSTATAATLAVAGTTNGNIDSNGDRDYYAITLTAGQTYLFRTAATSAADTTDTVITLRDAAGNQLATNDDAGEDAFSAVRYTATTTGTYYIDVSAFGTGTGAFNLTAFVTQPLALYTNDQISTQLTNTFWGGTSRRFNITTGGSLTYNVTALTAEGMFLAREAINLWSDTLGVTFTEVASGGQIIFDDAQTGAFATSTLVGGLITQSNVNVGTEWITTYGTSLRTYSFQTYVHEIGHALGLGHGGNYNGSADYAVDANYLNDSWSTTIMSYFDQAENTYFAAQGFTRQFAVSPMIADGIATTNLYGTATTTRVGNTVYGFNNTSGRDIYLAVAAQLPMAYTIVDHGGTDTLDYSGYTQAQRIDLNTETFSNVGGRVGNVSIARGTIIENAIGGSGIDVLIGNAVANTLDGGSGVSTLNGGAGNDRLILGSGASGSTIDGGANTDTLVVNSTLSSLAGIVGIEALELGGGAVITLTGAQFANGLALNTAVSGTGVVTVNMDAGINFLSQNFAFSGSGVTVTVNGSSGTDIIKSGTGIHTINGGGGNDQIRGGTAADIINGGADNDKIIGFTGADIITGGTGSDQFRYLFAGDSGLGAAADRITDYAIGSDRLNFALLDTNASLAGVQGFAFVGNAAFSGGGAASIRYTNSGADLLVQADIDGDGFADMEIILQGLNGGTLTATDFIL